MRYLELYLDSKLKTMKLFDYAQKILKSFKIEEEESIPNKLFALDIYSGFVELATMIDGFDDWGTKEWNNFVSMMSLAFKEKGKEDSVAYALAALNGLILGIVDVETNRSVVIEDVYNEDDPNVSICQTRIYFRVEQISTPFTSRFIEKLKTLIPQLYWVHELEIMNETELFNSVYVDIPIIKTYNKNIYSRQVDMIDLREESGQMLPEGWEV